MIIQTPIVAVKIDKLSTTQENLIKNSLDIGKFNVLLASTKTTTNHAINVQTLQDGFVYFVKNDDIIEPGDTISDIDTNSFDVVLIGSNYIPSGWYYSVNIDGSNAVVGRFVEFNDIGGDFLSKWGSTGTGDGQFNASYGITVNENNIFVTDHGNHRVQIFDLNGNFVSEFGSVGSGDGQFSNPYGITVNENNIFIADYGNNRVQIFDLVGTFVSKFGSVGSADGQFNGGVGIAINSTNIFITDLGNDRVQKFDLVGNFVSKFGSAGSGDGEFNAPYGITVNENNIFVTDFANNNVQKFI